MSMIRCPRCDIYVDIDWVEVVPIGNNEEVCVGCATEDEKKTYYGF